MIWNSEDFLTFQCYVISTDPSTTFKISCWLVVDNAILVSMDSVCENLFHGSSMQKEKRKETFPSDSKRKIGWKDDTPYVQWLAKCRKLKMQAHIEKKNSILYNGRTIMLACRRTAWRKIMAIQFSDNSNIYEISFEVRETS